MPSREEMYFLPENENNTTQDFLARDVENLVSEIKKNLRLSGFKNRHQRRIVRPSPYSDPSRNLSDSCETCIKNSCSNYFKTNVSCAHRTIGRVIKASTSTDDPYEMLQDLLRGGSLIKEAVKRLQKGLSPKQRYYYDSDEESSRSPLRLYRNLEPERGCSNTQNIPIKTLQHTVFTELINIIDSEEGVYSMGPHTLKVPAELFALNRKRLCEKLWNVSELNNKNSIIVLKGGELQNLYDTDVEYVFRQEQYFFWSFGVHEDGCYGAIHVPTGDAYLFVTRLSEKMEMWTGKLPTLDQFHQKYKVKEVYYVDKIVDVLKSLSPDVLLTLKGVNSDSNLQCQEATFHGIDGFKVDNTILFDYISECRVFKTNLEKEVMRYAARISSDAHKAIMKSIKSGMFEYQCEAMFLHYVYHTGGCRHVAYTCICGAGENGSILHYGHASHPNSKLIKDGDMCVFDMGAEYCGYAADITVSFPANGKFTEDQKNIYNAVLAANLAVQKAAKPGVSWPDMHILANKVMLEELKKIGIVQGDVEEMLEANIAAIFQPHGLGHFLGMAVHDVGGYLKGMPEKFKKPGLNKLRTSRVLEAGMALTIEPGCYFIDYLIDKALADPIQAKFLNETVLNRFRKFGGVRIEDDVFITENGIENYTSVPRTVEEIEKWMETKI